MSGDQDRARGEVKAAIPLVVRGVPEKHTPSRTGHQLVGSSGGGVRIARTPEDMNVVISRRGTEKRVVRSGSRGSSGRKAVEQVGGSVKALSPEAWRKRGLKQKGAHDIISGANHPLSLAILRGCIGT